MSVQYIFWNKSISKKELLEKIPDLRIEHHNGADWLIWNERSNLKINPPTLVDKETGEKSIDNNNIWELENHGYKNVKYIMDQIVSKFNLLFYTDNEQEIYWHEGDFYDMEEGVVEAMLRHGNYKVIDMKLGTSEIPIRSTEEYLEDPWKKHNKTKEPIKSTDLTISFDEHYNYQWEDNDLPF
jgi:hypothetical protein